MKIRELLGSKGTFTKRYTMQQLAVLLCSSMAFTLLQGWTSTTQEPIIEPALLVHLSILLLSSTVLLLPQYTTA